MIAKSEKRKELSLSLCMKLTQNSVILVKLLLMPLIVHLRKQPNLLLFFARFKYLQGIFKMET